nr:NADH dehydrogenase subunit 4 [Centropomus undecimalis]
MLKIIYALLMLITTSWIAPTKWLWPYAISFSFIISLYSVSMLDPSVHMTWTWITKYTTVDPISAPLITLSCWLLPLMLLASQHQISREPLVHQRIYISLLTSLQLALVMAFSVNEAMMFFIMFEATLIPTVIIITRWGGRMERLNAGTYFLFYTMMGSIPLLIALLLLQNKTGTLSFQTLQLLDPIPLKSHADIAWWAGCLLAFLVKLPLYGVHLWLPKAHVEAPIAGSMVLAGVLLKLGGYGMIRIMTVIVPAATKLAYPFIALALWGIVMTGSICMRQTDMKSLIAYSSVSHMCLVAAGIMLQTPWGLTGAIVLMIAHGLTSSALFCLANTSYERTHSRTLLLARGLQAIFPLMATWWFTVSLANISLPPLPNLMGELVIITSLFNWSRPTIMLMGLGILITAAYTLYMFLTSQRGKLPEHMTALEPSHSREHLLIALHIIPLILLILNPDLVWGWSA